MLAEGRVGGLCSADLLVQPRCFGQKTPVRPHQPQSPGAAADLTILDQLAGEVRFDRDRHGLAAVGAEDVDFLDGLEARQGAALPC